MAPLNELLVAEAEAAAVAAAVSSSNSTSRCVSQSRRENS